MIERNIYLDRLKDFIDKPQIKILTGIRRSGKSTVLRLLHRLLLERGVSDSQIILINLESFAYADLKSAPQLYAWIQERIDPIQKSYLLLDEIQQIHEWEKAVNSFLVDFNVDVYITGSNSHLLSSDLATYLAGRYVEIPIYTLSFSEFQLFREKNFPQESENEKSLQAYIHRGGFPVIHTAPYNEETAYQVVRDIYSSVILRDTIQRYRIRELELLDRLIRYAFDNIGNTFSGKNVADYFKRQQRKVDINTVYNYLHALEGAFILYRVPRYDIKGKEILKTLEKFYVADISLIHATMGYRGRIISGILENIVFLELKRRGYQVYVGKLDQREIDFVAEKPGERQYIQVAYLLESATTIERELSPLLSIRDNYPKYLLSLSPLAHDTIEGIYHLSLEEWLLADQ